MSIIFVLIPLAIIIVSIAIGVFFWAVKSNQFEDLERQGYNILFDDDIAKKQVESVEADLAEGDQSSPHEATPSDSLKQSKDGVSNVKRQSDD